MILASESLITSAPRAGEILESVRGRIVSGAWLPGAQVPTREEIEREFSASSRTVQRALSQLIEDGFLRSDGRRGTFVVDHPPHLWNMGLVFPGSSAESRRSGHWAALQASVGQGPDGRGLRWTTYCGLETPADAEDFRRLLYDVEMRRVAGLVFAAPPSKLAGSPIMDQPDLPRVVIAAESAGSAAVPLVYEGDSWLTKALDHLQEQGCRRIGIIVHAEGSLASMADCRLARELERRGLTSDPRWQQGVVGGQPMLARNLMRLMMDRPARERPDGLIVRDDSIAEDVTGALAAMGLGDGSIRLVVHANFPLPPRAHAPVWYLGYDMRVVLRKAAEWIQAAARGEGSRKRLTVEACSEDEVDWKRERPPASPAEGESA